MSVRSIKLSWLLIVSGAATLAILAEPGLVLIGFLLLIVPGLILSIMPAIFGYGCVFGLFCLGLRTGLERRGLDASPLAVNGIAALAAFSLGLGAAALSQVEAEARLARYSLGGVQVPSRIAVHGDIRLEIEHYGGRGCDGDCKTLLQSPGVRSVTIAGPPLEDFGALRDGRIALDRGTRYRLDDDDACHGAELDHDAAADRCLIKLPLLRRCDLLIRQGWWKEWDGSTRPSHWALRRPVEVDFAEVREPGRVLARVWFARTSAFSLPLLALPTCGSVWDTDLCWTRRALGNVRGRQPHASELLDLDRR